jgi:hypothetical protein
MKFLALCLTATLAACSSTDESKEDLTPTPDAGMSTDDDAGPVSPIDASTAALPFLSPCDPENDLCDADNGEFCFGFNAKGPHCTHQCDTPQECDAPSPGCNNMGVCKAPD